VVDARFALLHVCRKPIRERGWCWGSGRAVAGNYPDLGPPFAALLAEAQQDPSLGPLILERFITPRRAPIVQRLRDAQAAGQIASTVDPHTLLRSRLRALFHRLLLPSGPLDDTYASFIVDTILTGAARTA